MASFANDQEEFDFQQTELGKQVTNIKRQMICEYEKQLRIPRGEITTGELGRMTNIQTGEVSYFKI